MKAIITTIAIALFAMNCSAKIWTVSNVPSRPAQYTDPQTAHDSAWAGDTLLITGGGAQYYPGLLCKKPLVIIGEGLGTAMTYANLYSLTFSRVNSSLGADSCKVYGVYVYSMAIDPNFAGALAGQATLTNFLFERCYFSYATLYSYDALSKVTFRNCFSSGAISFPHNGYSQILLTNCIFWAGITINGNGITNNGNIIVRNSLFLAQGACFNNLFGVIIENNIFYLAEPTGANYCTFNNNLTYLCNSGTVPYGTNVGSGNLINVFPKFVNYPMMGAGFSWAHDYGLQAGSPAIGTGTNGTNIGITGGNAPVVSNLYQWPKIPIVTQVSIPVSSVPVGGNLQIQIKANTRK